MVDLNWLSITVYGYGKKSLTFIISVYSSSALYNTYLLTHKYSMYSMINLLQMLMSVLNTMVTVSTIVLTLMEVITVHVMRATNLMRMVSTALKLY